MPVIEKEVARPGTYWYIDPATGVPQKADFTPETLKYWHDQGNLMIQGGLSIPVPVEHQKLKPMTATEKVAATTLNNKGWVQGYKLKKIKDDGGNEVEALFSDLDIPDASFARDLPRTIRWTSPWISSFTDGNGKTWNGVISHLALTTRPRIVKQSPFPTIDAAMSLAAQLRDQAFSAQACAVASEGFGLSRAGLLKKKDEKFLPTYPVAFALWSGIGFAKDVPFDKDKKPPEEPGENEPPEKSLVDEDGDISIYEVLQDLLEAVGLPIEGISAENFHQKLYEAAMNSVKGKAGSETTSPSTTPSNPGSKTTVQEQPPLYMSLEQVQAITEPAQRAMAMSLVGLAEENKRLKAGQDRLTANAIEGAKTARQVRLDRLYKKLAPASRDKLVALASTAAFSMEDSGTVKDSMDSYLTVLEGSIPDLPPLLTKGSIALSEQPHPPEYQGEMTEERRTAVVSEWVKNGGLRTPAAPVR